MTLAPRLTPVDPLPARRDSQISGAHVVIALVSRLALFGLFQALAAAGFALSGVAAPWAASIAWWPVTVIAANLVSLGLLRALLRREGRRYRDLLRIQPGTLAADLRVTLVVTLISGVLAMVPNIGLAVLLWGDPGVPLSIFIQPLPVWAALVALIGFPVTIALSELPVYYGYVRPRLESTGLQPWLAIAVVGGIHGLQHAALPLVFDGSFLLWRALMFIPFACFLGVVLRWRPRLLPYLMVVHGLIDLSVVWMVFQASTGA